MWATTNLTVRSGPDSNDEQRRRPADRMADAVAIIPAPRRPKAYRAWRFMAMRRRNGLIIEPARAAEIAWTNPRAGGCPTKTARSCSARVKGARGNDRLAGTPLDLHGSPPAIRPVPPTPMSSPSWPTCWQDRIADCWRASCWAEPKPGSFQRADSLRFGTKVLRSVAVEIGRREQGPLDTTTSQRTRGRGRLELIAIASGWTTRPRGTGRVPGWAKPNAGPSWTATPPAAPALSHLRPARPERSPTA